MDTEPLAPHRTVYLDHNVWDYLRATGIDLGRALPRPSYALALTREAEFEIAPTPEPLRSFITEAVHRWGITTEQLFGWYDDRFPADQQRVAGFGQGVFAPASVVEFMGAQADRLGDMREKSRLLKHEADRAIAARSFSAVVLTLDEKRGPLKTAAAQGGAIVQLRRWPATPAGIRFAIDTASALLLEPVPGQ